MRHASDRFTRAAENATRKLRGNRPRDEYPDTAYTIPPATTGPATSMAPPAAGDADSPHSWIYFGVS